jgi:2-phospho-L-lactate guanylyltransferase (CobY/MobA/RfbA family)
MLYVMPAGRASALAAVANAPDDWRVKVEPPKRSLDQNAAQWPILQAFSRSIKWPVNGYLVLMSPEDWKDVLTAAFKRQTVRVAMGLDGGMVMLGTRTSKMTKPEFSDYLDFLHATAIERGVQLEVQHDPQRT